MICSSRIIFPSFGIIPQHSISILALNKHVNCQFVTFSRSHLELELILYLVPTRYWVFVV